MADTSSDAQRGDLIVDSNGVVWSVDIDSRADPNEFVLRVSKDSVRTYDVPDDEGPQVRFLRQTVRGDKRGGAVLTIKEVTDALNTTFSNLMKQQIMLRVRESADPKPSGGMGLGLFVFLLAVAVLAEGGKRRR